MRHREHPPRNMTRENLLVALATVVEAFEQQSGEAVGLYVELKHEEDDWQVYEYNGESLIPEDIGVMICKEIK